MPFLFEFQTFFCNFAVRYDKTATNLQNSINMVIRFKKGFTASMDVNKKNLPVIEQGVSYMAAIYCKSTNKRYVANGPTEELTGILKFTWPHGVTTDTNGKNIPDPSIKNGTASMKVGMYVMEIFASDKSFVTDHGAFVEVVESNILADNSNEGQSNS